MLTRSVLALPFDAHPQPPTHAKHDKSMNRFSDLAARLSRLPGCPLPRLPAQLGVPSPCLHGLCDFISQRLTRY